MRLILLCCITFFCTSVRAQVDADYTPFRTYTNYVYDNPIAPPEWTSVEPLAMPYIGMFGGDYYNGLESGLSVLMPTETEGVYNRVPHFAGLSRSEDQPGELIMSANDTVFILRFAAQVGDSWMARADLECHVDSIVVQDFMGVTDSVKYISTRHSNGEEFPSILISKEYGLLQGIYFTVPSLMHNAFVVRAFAQEGGYEIGIPFVYPYTIAEVQSGDEYYELLEVPKTFGGREGKRVTQRIFRNEFFNRCDPLFGGYELLFRVREVSFFQPADGGGNLDTVVSLPRFHRDVVPFIREGFGEDEWIVSPLGTFNVLPWESNDIVTIPELATHECYGYGIRRSLELISVNDVSYVLREGTIEKPTLYRGISREEETFEDASGVGAHLVGVNTHRVVCGIQYDFDSFYTSVVDFPDDPLITLAPNPASNRVMLSVPFDHGSVFLEVYDGTGRLVQQTAATGGDRWLNVEDMASGVYSVVFWSREGPVARRRLVVR